MSNNNSTPNPSGGIGFAGALTLLFIGLKLGHVINWSWWWVLAPSWIPLAAFVVLAVLGAIVAFVITVVKGRRASR